MERGNQPTGGEETTSGEDSDSSGTQERAHGDPGPAPSGGGEEVDLDMVDFDRVEFLEDGSMKAPILDDEGNIVNWVHADTLSSNELANSPIKPGETRFFDIAGHSVQMNDDGTIVPLD